MRWVAGIFVEGMEKGAAVGMGGELMDQALL